jgi:hypothetical protein
MNTNKYTYKYIFVSIFLNIYINTYRISIVIRIHQLIEKRNHKKANYNTTKKLKPDNIIQDIIKYYINLLSLYERRLQGRYRRRRGSGVLSIFRRCVEKKR